MARFTTARQSDPGRMPADAELAELYTRHGAAVLGVCRVLLRNRDEAQDAAQQTFLSAFRSLLAGTVPRHPAAWLSTIARNECVARIRRQMREPLPSGDAEEVEALPGPVATAAGSADLSALWQAIAELPEKQREALLLREFSGLSYEELADALDVSEPAVESLLVRARSTLRARLQPVYQTMVGLLPVDALRALLVRSEGGLPDPALTRGVGRIMTGTAAIIAAGGTVAVVGHHAAQKPASRPGAAVAAAPERPAVRRSAAPAPHVAAAPEPTAVPSAAAGTDSVSAPSGHPSAATEPPARVASARPAEVVLVADRVEAETEHADRPEPASPRGEDDPEPPTGGGESRAAAVAAAPSEPSEGDAGAVTLSAGEPAEAPSVREDHAPEPERASGGDLRSEGATAEEQAAEGNESGGGDLGASAAEDD